jgi:hypothetical protein
MVVAVLADIEVAEMDEASFTLRSVLCGDDDM